MSSKWFLSLSFPTKSRIHLFFLPRVTHVPPVTPSLTSSHHCYSIRNTSSNVVFQYKISHPYLLWRNTCITLYRHIHNFSRNVQTRSTARTREDHKSFKADLLPGTVVHSNFNLYVMSLHTQHKATVCSTPTRASDVIHLFSALIFGCAEYFILSTPDRRPKKEDCQVFLWQNRDM